MAGGATEEAVAHEWVAAEAVAAHAWEVVEEGAHAWEAAEAVELE